MREPKKIERMGKEFIINQLPLLKAVCLDKTLVSLVLPSLGSLDGFSMDSDVNMKDLFRLLSDGLSKMTDNDFKKFILDLLSCVQVIKPGEEVKEVNAETLDNIFAGDLMGLYEISFEVMRHNRFAPFAMVEGGKGTGLINGLSEQIGKQKRKTNSSETSENSQES